MKKSRFICTYLLIFCFFTWMGCGKTVAVKGTVKFQDGSPLTCGTVVFDDGSVAGQGKIQSDGSFTMGFDKEGNGLPPGNYKVCIIGAREVKKATAPSTASGFGEAKGKASDSFATVSPSLIHSKYGSIETTDLTCEVSSSMKNVTLTIEGPSKGK